MKFQIIDANISFLVCLQQFDKINAHYDNLQNILIQGKKKHLIIQKKGYPWLLLNQHNQLLNTFTGIVNICHLTETEIRRLHYRFSHPSIQRLHHLLNQARHNFNLNIIMQVREICEHY